MSYKRIAKISMIAVGVLAAGAALGDNVGSVAVTANTDFIVNIDDHAQDFSVDVSNYASPQNGGFSDYNIWSNSNETVTVNVGSAHTGDTDQMAYLIHTAPGAEVEVHEKIPYAISYQPCGGGSAILIGGTGSFNLDHNQANKALCDATPGKIQVTRLPARDAQGNVVPPAMGSYTSNITLTVQQPA